MKKKILYFGNNLGAKTLYKTSHETLSELLRKEGFNVKQYSSVQNKFLRMLDMIAGFFHHLNADFILIDTFSTVNFYYALVIGGLSRFFNKKYIPVLRGGNLPARLEKNPKLSRVYFDKAYENVSPSGFLKEVFQNKGFRVRLIPNTLPLELYRFKKREIFRPRLLWVRSFARHYKPAMAVEVLKKLKETHPGAELCMVGPAKDDSFEEVKSLVKSYGLEKSVVFTGALEKTEWLALSEKYDIFINTTNVDNTPVSVMEALALGLAVVSTNVGGIPYLLKDREDSMLVPPENPGAMTEAILELLNQPSLAQNLTENGRKKAESFAWEHVRQLWLDLLQ